MMKRFNSPTWWRAGAGAFPPGRTQLGRSARSLRGWLVLAAVAVLPVNAQSAPPPGDSRPLEWLGRGLVAIETADGVFLSWRVLGTDGDEVGFNLYRNGDKITGLALTGASNHLDRAGGPDDRYELEVVAKSEILERGGAVAVWPRREPADEGARRKRRPSLAYLEIPLSGPTADHVPGDMSVGDLDGDGEYELVFEWEGSTTWLEAVDLRGRRLWRIAGGPNVNKNKLSFLVHDLDGDGRAEVACKTGPGTIDGTGSHLRTGPAAGDDNRAVHRRKSGRLVEDPAYITVFDGLTGAERVTTLYWPPIGPLDEMKATWGDNYGHRASSIKSAVLHHRQLGPLIVFGRGIYSRVALAAYRLDGDQLRQVWTFDSEDPRHPDYRNYRGQGNHSVAVGDVDGDGSDELMYGACVIDHDGSGLYSTGMGHGDSHALGDLDPDHPGLEFFQGHENRTHGLSMRAAATGEILWEIPSRADVGRAWAADVSADHRGAECASSATPNYDCHGNEIGARYDAYAQPIYFDGDLQRELRKRTAIELGPSGRILTAWYYGASDIHHSKHDANLVADILGDWREELVMRRRDNKALLVFSSWFPTEHRIPTLMHDPTYRMNITVQNIGYNQPATPGFHLPDGPPERKVRTIRYSGTGDGHRPRSAGAPSAR